MDVSVIFGLMVVGLIAICVLVSILARSDD